MGVFLPDDAPIQANHGGGGMVRRRVLSSHVAALLPSPPWLDHPCDGGEQSMPQRLKPEVIAGPAARLNKLRKKSPPMPRPYCRHRSGDAFPGDLDGRTKIVPFPIPLSKPEFLSTLGSRALPVCALRLARWSESPAPVGHAFAPGCAQNPSLATRESPSLARGAFSGGGTRARRPSVPN
jgi:hypothetical protein